jgi:hypothetical protein
MPILLAPFCRRRNPRQRTGTIAMYATRGRRRADRAPAPLSGRRHPPLRPVKGLELLDPAALDAVMLACSARPAVEAVRTACASPQRPAGIRRVGALPQSTLSSRPASEYSQVDETGSCSGKSCAAICSTIPCPMLSQTKHQWEVKLRELDK